MRRHHRVHHVDDAVAGGDVGTDDVGNLSVGGVDADHSEETFCDNDAAAKGLDLQLEKEKATFSYAGNKGKLI